MNPLKPRDKVTQHMTRDGLTLDNQTTGESVNVSSREAEQEYTAQPEGAAEKILERADGLHDRHKAKKAAKDAGETVAQATGPVSRLQFTAEERASPELAPYIKKTEKRADQADKVAVFQNVLNFRGGKQVFHILRRTCGNPAPLTKTLPNLAGKSRRLFLTQKQMKLITEIPCRLALAAVLGDAPPNLVLDNEHTDFL